MFSDLLSLLSSSSKVPVDERRETIRLNSRIPVLLKLGNTTKEVTVTNASLTGLRIQSPSKIKKNSQVTLHRDSHGGPVRAKVQWCRSAKDKSGYQIGLSYEESKSSLKASWIKPALKDLGFTVTRISEKRSLTRIKGVNKTKCYLKNAEGETYTKGLILNLSVGGALVESEVEFPEAYELFLKVDRQNKLKEFSVACSVQSSQKNPKTRMVELGLQFLENDGRLLKIIKGHMSSMMDDS